MVQVIWEIILAFSAVLVFICLILALNFRKKKENKTLILILIIVYGILISVLLVIDGIEIIASDSWHTGLVLGLPALTALTIGMVLVLYNEQKYVLWHGYLAGSSWFVTLLNVILLVTLSEQQIVGYSGLIHAIHILLGATGLISGFASMLFGISGQRNLARLTGYFTLIGWWGCFLLSFFI